MDGSVNDDGYIPARFQELHYSFAASGERGPARFGIGILFQPS